MKRLSILILALAAGAFGQVYTAVVTGGGSGYTTAPTITATGGGCTTQPTFTSTVASGALTSVVPTFAGAGCTAAPTLAIGGPGSGAAATAELLPATVVVLSTVPSASGVSVQPSPSGGYTAWQYICWLTVPQQRVPFYAAKLFTMSGTAQVTSYVGLPASVGPGITSALANGIITEYLDSMILPNSVAGSTAETAMVSDCSAKQALVSAWNPWQYYGTYYNGNWTVITIQ